MIDRTRIKVGNQRPSALRIKPRQRQEIMVAEDFEEGNEAKISQISGPGNKKGSSSGAQRRNLN